jgi:hypothetical protein
VIPFLDITEFSVGKSSFKIKIWRNEMAKNEDSAVNKLPPEDPCRLQTNGPISSLNEAWVHVLDRCVINLHLSEVILPLMRDCFFAGATYAVLLRQKGHGDELTRDIAGFISEESRPVTPQAL